VSGSDGGDALLDGHLETVVSPVSVRLLNEIERRPATSSGAQRVLDSTRSATVDGDQVRLTSG
jgi:hypothetical protein